jgi:hypothetical protein
LRIREREGERERHTQTDRETDREAQFVPNISVGCRDDIKHLETLNAFK